MFLAVDESRFLSKVFPRVFFSSRFLALTSKLLRAEIVGGEESEARLARTRLWGTRRFKLQA